MVIVRFDEVALAGSVKVSHDFEKYGSLGVENQYLIEEVVILCLCPCQGLSNSGSLASTDLISLFPVVPKCLNSERLNVLN